MKRRSANPQQWGWIVGVVVISLAALWGLGRIGQPPANPPPTDQRPPAAKIAALLPEPPLSPSKFLNASPEAEYVGSQACAACHETEHQSYRKTAHSRALEAVRLHQEPPDAQWQHAPSGRDLQIVRSGQTILHRQSLAGPGERSLVTEERPIKYAIGSGHHSRSFLAEIDGFLVESPLTWYAAKPGWGMSPGYDQPEHLGFERQVDHGCLVCHAGRVEIQGNNRDRVTLHELAIGCESCHGPGSLHVALRSAATSEGNSAAKRIGEDLTIVHPARLSRGERDAVCAGCHLRGAATVFIRGRSFNDLRPGRRLEEVRLDYVAAGTGDEMTVVGHMEQMGASACYQKSDSLTCITCHDPHAPPTEATKVAFFREKCNDCHHEQCGLSRDKRLQRDPADNCASCHMPQRPTDLPHFAFTHHRIGFHADAVPRSTSSAPLPAIVPVADGPQLSPPDRDRCLGLAYLEFADKQTSDETRGQCLAHAERLLTAAREHGAGDADVWAGLARLAWERGDWSHGRELAAQALALDDRGSGARTTALVVEANSAFELQDFSAAIAAALQLTVRRRRSDDWLLLGRAYGASGQFAAAAEALTKSANIQPFRAETRLLLAGTHERLRQPEEARRQKSIAELLGQPRR